MGFRGGTRAVGLLAVCLLSAGCVDTVAGRPTGAGGAVRVVPLEQILPSGDEVNAAVGNKLMPEGPPEVGGIAVLPNGIRDDNDATPVECIGVTSALLRVVYEEALVRAVAAQNYWNSDLSVAVFSVRAGAVRLSSSTDAQRLFVSFVRQWQKCAGTTVTLRTHDSENTELYLRVEDVKVDGPLLSATVVSWDNHHTPPTPDERAVGIGSDVVVDVRVSVGPGAQAATRAVDLARVMLQNVASTS
ncbi:sensor domain-containing protein [Mycobacterium shigaense]|uniref:sensor domain-containing protein n=1 Tax=Mycobacterium shigaense TaxID=722731 RepID=UPI000E57D9B9|nr:sensor domain-containing protein [Mycobacterium shigaense]